MITIFSTTNRKDSYTNKVANIYFSILKEKNIQSQVFDFQKLPIDFLFSNAFGNTTNDFDSIVNKHLLNVDKFIFICPEYNGSIPGVLKSFIDCTNPKLYKSKKVSLVGLSSGRAGNLRGLDHLTSILHHLGSEVLSFKPIFSSIHESFQGDELINAQYLKEVNNHIDSFNEF